METEPLLIPYLNNPRRKPLQPPHLSTTPPPSSLFPLPENEAVITIPSSPLSIQPPQPSTPSPSLTPSKELKDRLIFGPSSPPSTSSTLDALTLDSSLHQLDPSPTLISPSSPVFWSKSKSNLHRSKTAPAITIVNDSTLHSPSHTKPKFSSNTIVRQAVLLLILYLCFGVIMYSLNRDHFTAAETHPFVDALYFCIVTMCTIGYGDITPRTTWAKIYSIFFVIIGFGFVDVLLSAMVSYVLDLQENLLLTTAKGGNGKHDLAKTYIFDLKKGRMRIRMKVGLALGVVVLCIGLGTGVMHFLEHLGWVDSFYLSVMSVTTVGYGDHAFNSLYGRLFASVWLLVSTLAVARAFLYLAEARIDKRHRRLAKWVLCQDMTISEFLAADIDNNGFVSKSEYVIYKLKEMGKIAEKDILQICNQFDRLDSGNCGKITLADLMENHH